MATNTQFVDPISNTSNLMSGAMSDVILGLTSLLTGVVAAGRTWQARAEQRRHLAALDSRLLDDMGMTREEALREGHKPFWMA